MTGMCAVSGSFFNYGNALVPLIPGKLISIKIMSGSALRAVLMPVVPSQAVSRRISARLAIMFSTNNKLAGLSSIYSRV